MEHWAKERAGIPVPLELEIPPEAEAIIEEDKQFWNFKDDITPDEEGELLRWKYSYPRTRELFEWLLWGKPGSFCQIQALSVELTEATDHEVQTLGEPQVRLLVSSGRDDVSEIADEAKSGDKKSEVLIVEGNIDSDNPNSTIFWSNMAQSSKNSKGCGQGRGFGQGRGAPPLIGPPAWGQPPWLNMGYYPPYMPMSMPSLHGMFFGEQHSENMGYPRGDFRPPSPPKAP